jgi:SAM-dependent methyltransferase
MNKKILKAGRHLDLGCGTKPRNPYKFSELCGVDLYRSEAIDDTFDIRVANLSIEGIPFPDNHFDSVSAFDFLEHIPRVMLKNEIETRFPFIELMNEIWRVLKPGGLFYALTPAYPHPEAFQDPTHVNIITDKTHLYFCTQKLYAKNYGFNGEFTQLRVDWAHTKYSQTAKNNLKEKLSSIFRTIFKTKKSHLLWEFSAIKK